MVNQITNADGVTYSIGQRVQSNEGWIGTIHAIKNGRLFVTPDNLFDVPQFRRWHLNPTAILMGGKSYYCEPQDDGMTMGNYIPI